MYELPVKVEVGGVEYSIRNKGDYRMILDLFSILEDEELNNSERLMSALIIFYDGMEDVDDLNQFSDIEDAATKMFDFFNAGKAESGRRARKLLDWDSDSAMIVSAINNVAGKEIRSLEYLHWWTFISYYMSVGESTLSTVVSIRDKVSKGKKLEKWERQFKNENPQYFNWKSKSVDEIDDEKWLMSVWNKE